MSPWLRSVLQFGLSILFIIIGIFVIIEFCLFCVAQCNKDTTHIMVTQHSEMIAKAYEISHEDPEPAENLWP